eukprot:SAG31_NODE_1499_length_8091_cov_2.089590_3_plen_1240_part_00
MWQNLIIEEKEKLVHQLEEALAKSGNYEDQLKEAQRIQSRLQSELDTAAAKLTAHEGGTSTGVGAGTDLSSMGASPGNAVVASPQVAAAEQRARELQLKLDSMQDELESTKQRATERENDAKTLENLLKDCEQRLQQLQQQRDTDKIARDRAADELQVQKDEVARLEARLTAAGREAAEERREFASTSASLNAQIANAEAALKEMTAKEAAARGDYLREVEKEAAARTDYDREVTKHGEARTQLQAIKAEVAALQTRCKRAQMEARASVSDADAANAAAASAKEALDQQVSKYAEELRQAREANQDLRDQLDSLPETHFGGAEGVSMQLGDNQIEMIDPDVDAAGASDQPGVASDSTGGSSGRRSSGRLVSQVEVLRQLRTHERELSAQLAVKEAHALAVEATRDSLRSELDGLKRTQQAELEHRSEIQDVSATELAELREKANRFDREHAPLLDSNQLLRTAAEDKKQKLEELEAKVDSLQKDLDVLEETKRVAEAKAASADQTAAAATKEKEEYRVKMQLALDRDAEHEKQKAAQVKLEEQVAVLQKEQVAVLQKANDESLAEFQTNIAALCSIPAVRNPQIIKEKLLPEHTISTEYNVLQPIVDAFNKWGPLLQKRFAENKKFFSEKRILLTQKQKLTSELETLKEELASAKSAGVSSSAMADDGSLQAHVDPDTAMSDKQTPDRRQQLERQKSAVNDKSRLAQTDSATTTQQATKPAIPRTKSGATPASSPAAARSAKVAAAKAVSPAATKPVAGAGKPISAAGAGTSGAAAAKPLAAAAPKTHATAGLKSTKSNAEAAGSASVAAAAKPTAAAATAKRTAAAAAAKPTAAAAAAKRTAAAAAAKPTAAAVAAKRTAAAAAAKSAAAAGGGSSGAATDKTSQNAAAVAAVAKPSTAGKPATTTAKSAAAAAGGITGAAAAKPGSTSKLTTAAGPGKPTAAAAGGASGTAAAKTPAVAAAGKRSAAAAGKPTATAAAGISAAAVAKPSAAAAAAKQPAAAAGTAAAKPPAVAAVGKPTAPAAGSTSGVAPAKPHAAVQAASQVVRPKPSSTKVATSPSQAQEDVPVEEVSGHAVESGAGQKRKVAQTQLSAASISTAKVAKITPTGTPGAQVSEAALIVPTAADDGTTMEDSAIDRHVTEQGEETLADVVNWTDEGGVAEVAEVHIDTSATDANGYDDESSSAGAMLSDSFAIEDVAGTASLGDEEIGDEEALASPDEHSPLAKPTHVDPLPLPQS